MTRPDILLRAEGLLTLIATCWFFQHFHPHQWMQFALLFLVPDLSQLGYAAGKKSPAAAFYNLVHSYGFPLCLALYGLVRTNDHAGFFALIWIAHISFDRLLGNGLKFPGLFKYTHIQRSASASGTEPAR